jgi:NAD(P)-dependent dehydrogenase (short-subunit alcohol dehydrogenase family)
MGGEYIEETYELRELVSRYSTRSCIITCDFSNADKMLAAAIELKRVCGSHPIDVFINAGGIAYDGTMDIMKCTAPEMMRAFDLEVIGPLYFLQNILPNMSNSENPRAVLLSSIVGSNFNVQRDYRSTAAPYCIAKAAVNMLVTCFRAELEQAEVTVTSLHPGWASTKEGITPETNKDPPSALVDSVRKCMRTINHLDHERHGLFIDYQGSQLRY